MVSINRLAVSLALAVLVDLSLFFASGCVDALGVFGNLTRLWLCAALRCLALTAVVLLGVGELKPLLIRFTAVHSALPAVLESASRALYHEGTRCGFPADVRCWVMFAGASLAAAMFWELAIPDTDEDNDDNKKQESKQLFVRVLVLYKPFYHLLAGGFLFLALAVTCKLEGSRQQHCIYLTIPVAQRRPVFHFLSSVSAGCRGGFLLCAINAFTGRIKFQLFDALTKQEIGFFETVKTGQLTSRLSEDTTLMAKTVCLNANVLLRTFIRTMGTIYFMMSLSWKLTLLVLMETPVTGLIEKVYDTYYQRLSLALQNSLAKAGEAVTEAVSGIRVVRSFKAEKHEACRYGNLLKDINTTKTRQGTARAVCLLAQRFIGLGMQVLMLYYGRRFINSGHMTTGSLVSFILYQSHLGLGIRILAHSVGSMLNSVSAAGKVFEYLDRKPQVSTDGELKPDAMKGHVTFQQVNFAYPTCPEKKVLQDFSLELKPSQMTALVGASGEGKSTCVSLLERFYEPQDGQILLDGKPLNSYEHHFLHEKIAVVNQDPVLFSTSIRDNIAYGLSDCSLDQIQEAARNAGAHDFISKLKSGYDTVLGETNSLLSKSERQRIAIARALVRHPQVLVLDEITSSLDGHGENKVQEALARCSNQTLLIIAHRLKTIEKADQIVVISQGRVEEQGTHQELMARKGMYYKQREKLFTEGAEPQRRPHVVD
uniref:Transporter associated with antigen processing, subunit type a n=1 Tax=Takifugu rubripes TaxID=31033 RepID=A0A674MSC9_TAKRU